MYFNIQPACACTLANAHTYQSYKFKTYADTIHMPLIFSVYISPNYLHTDISLQYQAQKKASFMDINGYGYFQKKLWILQDGPKIQKKNTKKVSKKNNST